GSWFGDKRSEVLLVFREPGANTLDVVDRVKAAMPGLKESIPRAVHVDLVSDRSLSIRASVQEVEFTLNAAEAPGGADRRREVLHAGRTGHSHRRAARTGPVPI